MKTYWVFAKSGPYNDGFECHEGEAQFWADLNYTVVCRQNPSMHLIGQS